MPHSPSAQTLSDASASPAQEFAVTVDFRTPIFFFYTESIVARDCCILHALMSTRGGWTLKATALGAQWLAQLLRRKGVDVGSVRLIARCVS